MYIGVFNKVGFLILLYSIALTCSSQPVHIGEKVPNIQIGNIHNFTKSELYLTDLIGQDIILDFGNIGCSSCIKNIAKLDSIKKGQTLNLNVFWITNNSPKQIQGFLLKNRIGQKIKIPIIAGDSLLNKFFPHNSIPHYAWIDKKGILVATTSSDFITKDNLEKFSSGKKIDFVFKTDSAYDPANAFLY